MSKSKKIYDDRYNLDNLLKQAKWDKKVGKNTWSAHAYKGGYCIDFLVEQLPEGLYTGQPYVDAYFIEKYIYHKVLDLGGIVWDKEHLARELVRARELVKCFMTEYQEETRKESRFLAHDTKANRTRMLQKVEKENYNTRSETLNRLMSETEKKGVSDLLNEQYNEATYIARLFGWIGTWMPGEVSSAQRRFYGLPLSERNYIVGLMATAYRHASITNLILAVGLTVGSLASARYAYNRWWKADREVDLIIHLHSVDRHGNPVTMDHTELTEVIKYVKRFFTDYQSPERKNLFKKQATPRAGIVVHWISSKFSGGPKGVKGPKTGNKITLTGKSTAKDLRNPLEIQKKLRTELATKYGFSAYVPGSYSDVDSTKIEINLPIYKHSVSIYADCQNTRSFLHAGEDLVNYYHILGIQGSTATERSIERAYQKTLAEYSKKYSAFSDSKSAENLAHVLRAGEILRNPYKRKQYDAFTRGDVILIRKSGNKKGFCYRYENLVEYFKGRLKTQMVVEKIYGCKLTSENRFTATKPLMWVPGLDLWLDSEKSLKALHEEQSGWYVAYATEKYHIVPSRSCSNEDEGYKADSSTIKSVVAYVLVPEVPTFK